MGRRPTASHGILFPDWETPDWLQWERRLWRRGFREVAGVDEAGRGPLAGPVVAAAVIVRKEDPLLGVDDSKKLSPDRREWWFGEILRRSRAVGCGLAEPGEIDRMNVLQATFQAMARAIRGLLVPPDFILVDGNRPLPTSIPQKPVVKGDKTSVSIAAASIVAKVVRDRIMRHLHEIYPQYGFLSNKGYGTRDHLQALARFGPCPVHRRTFGGVRERIDKGVPGGFTDPEPGS